MGAPFAAETLAVVAAMTAKPSDDRQRKIDALVKALVAAGVWSKMGVLYIFAAADAQASLLNWKAPAGTAALATNSPAFTADRGYVGDGTAAYIDTQQVWNVIPGVGQDSAHLGVYAFYGAASTANTSGLAGVGTVGVGRSAGNMISRMNATTATTSDAVPAVGTHLCASRASSAGYERYIDGAAVTAAVVASATPSAANLTALRRDAGYAPSPTSVRALHAGSALTAGEVLAARNAIQAYMAAVGAQ